MHVRLRKLIGTVAVLVFLIVYCLAAMALGVLVTSHRGAAAQLIYFLAAGFGWLPPVMLIIRWMVRA
jgi:hypothetical protein